MNPLPPVRFGAVYRIEIPRQLRDLNEYSILKMAFPASKKTIFIYNNNTYAVVDEENDPAASEYNKRQKQIYKQCRQAEQEALEQIYKEHAIQKRRFSWQVKHFLRGIRELFLYMPDPQLLKNILSKVYERQENEEKAVEALKAEFAAQVRGVIKVKAPEVYIEPVIVPWKPDKSREVPPRNPHIGHREA